MPIPSHDLDGVCVFGGLGLGSKLFALPCFAWIYAVGDELAGFVSFVASLPGILEGHVGIDAKGDSFFLAPMAILETPPLAPSRGNFQIKAATVE